MAISTQILSDVEVDGSIVLIHDYPDFPLNPKVGQFCLVNNQAYFYLVFQGIETWYPFAAKPNYYLHTQALPAITWTVNHNLGTNNLFVQIRNSEGNLVNASMVPSNVNSFQVKFTSAISGTLMVLSPADIDVPVVQASYMSIANGAVVLDSSGVKINGTYALTEASVALKANSTDLDAEISARIAADLLAAPQETTYTKTQVDAAIASATPSFSTLTGKPTTISGYGITDALTATAIADAIAVETTRATDVENSLLSEILTNITNSAVASSSAATDLAAEVTRATDAEATLQANIDSNSASIATESARAQAAELILAPLNSPTFTGVVNGVTQDMVGLNAVDNTADSEKPVSTAQAAAIAVETDRAMTAEALLAPQATTYTKTESDARIQAVVGAAPAALDTLAEIATQLASDENAAAALVTTVATKVDKVTGKGLSTEDYTTTEKTKLAAVTGANTGDETLATIKTKLGITTLSGSNTGDQVIPTTLPASDVSAWAKAATKPTYTATEVGLGNVNNTTDLLKPVSTATQTALDLKAPLASPTFTGTVSGITATMVGLGNVNNTSDLLKPISTTTQTALDLKANQTTTYTKTQVDSAIAATNVKTQPIIEHSKTISANYTIAAGNNAVSVGPLITNAGVSVTVPALSRWVIL